MKHYATLELCPETRDVGNLPQVIPLRKEVTVIGRSYQCDVSLDSSAAPNTISRRHATIFRNEKGRFYIRDEASTNGMFLNCRKVAEAPLKDGDHLQFGGAAGVAYGVALVHNNSKTPIMYRFRSASRGLDNEESPRGNRHTETMRLDHEEDHDNSHSHRDIKKKKRKTSSSSNHDGDDDGSSPPPVRPFPFYLLPETAHDIIASYLTDKEMHQVMESTQRLLQMYGGRVKKVVLSRSPYLYRDLHTVMPSLLQRRPCLTSLIIERCKASEMISLAQSLGSGAGAYHKLTSLQFELCCEADKVVSALGTALGCRMSPTVMPLQSLFIKVSPLAQDTDLSPLFLSSACEALEVVHIKGCRVGARAIGALQEWLMRTKAPKLHTLIITSEVPAAFTTALSSSGVAPNLQVLCLTLLRSPQPLEDLSDAVERGSWPHLEELRIVSDFSAHGMILTRLMRALRCGAGGMKKLGVFHLMGGDNGGVAVARELWEGSCPQLEELDLRSQTGQLGNLVGTELARALEGGAPFATTLRRLTLQGCGINEQRMKDLGPAFTRCPHLAYLDLSDNKLSVMGMKYLADAMKDGALAALQELRLVRVDTNQAGLMFLILALEEPGVCRCLQRLFVDRVFMDGSSQQAFKRLTNGVRRRMIGVSRLEVISVDRYFNE